MEKSARRKPEPPRPEVEALLRLLDDEILRSRLSKRKLEKMLSHGQGYVASLMRGRIELKVEHVWDLAEALGIEPLLLFYRSAPQKNQERFLRELQLQPAAEDAEAARPAPPITLAEIEDMVRKMVRQELSRLGGM